MSPLAASTYYRRNISKVLPIGGAILFSVFLITSIATLLNSVDASIEIHYGFTRHFDVLGSQYLPEVPPDVVDKATHLPEVGRVVVVSPWFLSIKAIFGEMPAPVYGVDPGDIPFLMAQSGNHLEAGGRFPEVNEPEIVLSRGWANNLHVKVGDSLDPSGGRDAEPLERQRVVGIVSGGDNLAFADLTYFKLALPPNVLRPNYLIFPRTPELHDRLSHDLRSLVEHPTAHGLLPSDTRWLRVYSFAGLVQTFRRTLGYLYLFLSIIDMLVIGVIAVLAGFLANIYFEQRLAEFGLLSALGFRRELLAGRLVRETGLLVVTSWSAGLVLTYAAAAGAVHFVLEPRGLVLSHINATAIFYSLPTPFLVGLASLATVLTRLYRLDPIEIMERR